MTSSKLKVSITDNYVHPEFTATGCCDTGDGILIESGSSGVLVQGNVVVYGESNIEVPTTGHPEIHVVGNFLLNRPAPFPRGQQVQAWHVSDVWVENNYGLSSTSGTYEYPENQEDAFNFGYTSGTIVAQNNYITGGHSASGCGLIADEAANGCQFLGNSLLNTGQCGIGIASGTSSVVDSNRVLNTTPVRGAGNTSIRSEPVLRRVRPDDRDQQRRVPAQDRRIAIRLLERRRVRSVTETNDIWDTQAQTMLSPPAQKMPPPSIPPQPYACVAPSPF